MEENHQGTNYYGYPSYNQYVYPFQYSAQDSQNPSFYNSYSDNRHILTQNLSNSPQSVISTPLSSPNDNCHTLAPHSLPPSPHPHLNSLQVSRAMDYSSQIIHALPEQLGNQLDTYINDDCANSNYGMINVRSNKSEISQQFMIERGNYSSDISNIPEISPVDFSSHQNQKDPKIESPQNMNCYSNEMFNQNEIKCEQVLASDHPSYLPFNDTLNLDNNINGNEISNVQFPSQKLIKTRFNTNVMNVQIDNDLQEIIANQHSKSNCTNVNSDVTSFETPKILTQGQNFHESHIKTNNYNDAFVSVNNSTNLDVSKYNYSTVNQSLLNKNGQLESYSNSLNENINSSVLSTNNSYSSDEISKADIILNKENAYSESLSISSQNINKNREPTSRVACFSTKVLPEKNETCDFDPQNELLDNCSTEEQKSIKSSNNRWLNSSAISINSKTVSENEVVNNIERNRINENINQLTNYEVLMPKIEPEDGSYNEVLINGCEQNYETESEFDKLNYKCNLCPASFTLKSDLISHLINHNKIEPDNLESSKSNEKHFLNNCNNKENSDFIKTPQENLSGLLNVSYGLVAQYMKHHIEAALEKSEGFEQSYDTDALSILESSQNIEHLDQDEIPDDAKSFIQNLESFQEPDPYITLPDLQSGLVRSGAIDPGPSSDKRFVCDECGRRFKTKQSMQVHGRVHTGEKPYHCLRCDKRFAYAGSFHDHKRIHDGNPRVRPKPHVCELCDAAFNDKYKLIVHLRKHDGVRPFKCEECPASFAVRGSLRRHSIVHSVSDAKLYSCDECGKEFGQKSTCTRHKMVHLDATLSCGFCPAMFKEPGQLNRHLRTSHPDEYNVKFSSSEDGEYACDFCPLKFKRKFERKLHVLGHADERPFACRECPATFVRRSYLSVHMRTHTNERPYKCKTCESAFKTWTALKFHTRTHTGEKPYSCSTCGSRFAQKSALTSHVRVHTGETPFKCSECPAAFKHSTTLTIHRRKHTGERPYVCEVCGRSFVQKPHLVVHQRLHFDIKPLPCPNCDKIFYKEENLKSHVESNCELIPEEKPDIFGEKKSFKYGANRSTKPFKCSYCDLVFQVRSALTIHECRHTGLKPFRCDRCPASFLHRSNLSSHRRKHTGERPYGCGQCSAAFTMKSYLTMHLRKHSGEKPFRCDLCSSRFAQRTALATHRRIHTGETPYRCQICGDAFRDGANFWRHKKRHEPGYVAPKPRGRSKKNIKKDKRKLDNLSPIRRNPQRKSRETKKFYEELPDENLISMAEDDFIASKFKVKSDLNDEFKTENESNISNKQIKLENLDNEIKQEDTDENLEKSPEENDVIDTFGYLPLTVEIKTEFDDDNKGDD